MWASTMLVRACFIAGWLLRHAAGTSQTDRGFAGSVRGTSIQSFKVMDVLERALELEKSGVKVCHLEVGQPQSGAPKKVIDAAVRYLTGDRLGYTAAMGVSELRARISQHYSQKYSRSDGEPLQVPAERILVTTGSSGAFLLAFLGAFDPGDIVCVASSGYPCYRNILTALGCEVLTVPVNKDFKVTAKELTEASKSLWETRQKKPKGLILSSPSNPTGALLTPEELRGLCEYCDREGVQFISDEIYHGISYGGREASALAYSDKALVINSFSKYYSMTGWRLGWLVAPSLMTAALNKLQQNFFISAPSLAQLAAGHAAFDCDEELKGHVERYATNRAILLEGLRDMGFDKVAPADGAFYIYVDTAEQLEDGVQFCRDLLETAHVALTPGTDFEDPATDLGRKRLRLSYCGSTEDMKEAMQRMKGFLRTYPGRKGRRDGQ